MEVNAIFTLLDNILQAKQVDASSMQVYDAIALCAKQDTQMRQLANYIANNMQLEFDIDISKSYTDVINLNNAAYCNVTVDKQSGSGNVTLQFLTRQLFDVKAYCKVNDSMITMTPAISYTAAGTIVQFSNINNSTNTLIVKFF